MDNIQTLMYSGQVPWHGLGTYVGENEITAEEAIEKAGLTWEVEKVQMYIPGKGTIIEPNEPTTLIATGDYRIRRVDNGFLFDGVTGPYYRPVQNREAFNFFDGVVTAGEAMYHTAGALGNGEIVWILAKMPGDFEVTKGDKVESYMLLHTSHIPGKALGMAMTPIRVVCQNTLNVAIKGIGKKGFRHTHVKELMPKVHEAQEILGTADLYMRNMKTQIDRLVNEKFTEAQMQEFALALVDEDPNSDIEELSGSKIRIVTSLNHLFSEGVGQSLVAGTKWAAFNAVTEWTDHWANPGVRMEIDQDRRLQEAWFGKGAELKQRAWAELVA